MGQYKLQLKLKPHIGFLITWYPGYEFIIDIPFVRIYIGLTDHAHGFDIFGWKK